jgi:hypothetical protein
VCNRLPNVYNDAYICVESKSLRIFHH